MKPEIESRLESANPVFRLLYGDSGLDRQKDRYRKLILDFQSEFKSHEGMLFSTPGRTEMGGNHTDHNHGCVLAAGIHLDTIGIAAPSEDSKVIVISEGYPAPFEIDLSDLSPRAGEQGTTQALIRGIASRFCGMGKKIGGFRARIASDVMVGSGLSSSASVEVLLATLFNELFHAGLPALQLARIGQFAENEYFGKPCGLMDQMTCALGGVVAIDFRKPEEPVVRQIPFSLEAFDYRLLVIDTGGSHADLTESYASVPREMREVAVCLNGTVMRDVSRASFFEALPGLRAKVGDRALLRAFHFIEDNERVEKQVKALENGNFPSFLDLVRRSGDSSFKRLQNIHSPQNPKEQGVALALALTEHFLETIGEGACRVHGGGFAGTIQAYMPSGAVEAYRSRMESVFGQGTVHSLSIRPRGTLVVDAR